MADMANLVRSSAMLNELAQVIDVESEVTPVTYINSAADLKAFCGQHDGIVCTHPMPQNPGMEFCQTGKVLFFPDQHLAAIRLRMVFLGEMVTWDFTQAMGG